jgi:4-hydroxythreonine-4-phosphate dehydrogenase
MGDPAGIGPEVTVKAATDRRVLRACHPVVLGSYQLMFSAVGKFIKSPAVRRIVCPEEAKISGGGISVLNCTDLNHGKIETRKVTKLSGRMAADSVFCAVGLALSGQIDALVTAPLSKKGLRLAGYDFPGHTELLAYLTATSRYAMMFVSLHRKVVLVTTHLPLAEVARNISRKVILDKLEVTHAALQKHFGLKRPRIGVCGLNPHCGEEGVLGSEERRIIVPAVKAARRKRMRVDGPFPSDTIFSPAMATNFDCILAMYHDQGLIPLKMRGLGEAVNVTIGLPIVRTSPDFGTALDIAGKGLADHKGMVNAILLAVRMARETKKR